MSDYHLSFLFSSLVLPVKDADARKFTTVPFTHVTFKSRIEGIKECTDNGDLESGTRQRLLFAQIRILFVSKKTHDCRTDNGGRGNVGLRKSSLHKVGHRVFGRFDGVRVEETTQDRVSLAFQGQGGN